MKHVRIEKDCLGKVEVPQNAYYGAETMRAVENFPISGQTPNPAYIKSFLYIKKAAACTHQKLKLLPDNYADAIVQSIDEMIEGKYADQFVVDPYQAGAGTSLHMNVNEIIANRANEILGAPVGSYKFINPHDQVNMSQSTNDVVPTAVRIMCLLLLPQLQKELHLLEKELLAKAQEWQTIIKSGRTHLQDALPLTLGQEFGAYANALTCDQERIKHAENNLLRLGIGGTAVGTGLNSPPGYQKRMIEELTSLTKVPFVSSKNLFESMQNTADFLELSSQLRILATTLIRIGNDLRLLGSGPKTGFAEITLPAVQPGSSIMPGKVNPSIVEMITMVSYQVIGFDQAILNATLAGQLELNVMLPLISFNLSTQIELLTNAMGIFTTKCIKGIVANRDRCEFWFEQSLGIGAILNTIIGYDKASEVVIYAKEKNISIGQATVAKGYLTPTQLKELFTKEKLTGTT